MKYSINFSIPNTNFNLIGYDPSIFIKKIPKKNGVQLFTEWYLEYEKGVSQAFVEIDIIKNVEQWIKNKVIAEPSWADQLHREAENYNREYFDFGRSIVEMDLKVLDNEELFGLYKQLRDYQVLSHSHAISTTWFLDGYSEVFTNYLKERLANYLQEQGINDKKTLVEYFTILTTPHKESFTSEEQIEFLELLLKIKNGGGKIEDFLDNIVMHFNQWHWVPYGYIGPAYTLDYYLGRVKEELNIENIEKLLEEEKTRGVRLKKERDILINKIELKGNLRNYFDIARDIIWLKDFRKYCIWHGHYVLDMITKEIARRMHISHFQANHLLTEEVEQALISGKIDEHLLNERIKYTIIHSTEHESKFFYGREAKEIRDKLEVEEVEVDISEGFRGTCACPGEVTGEVKVVNSVSDIYKVNNGDIMLAFTTYPSMLPAMKRAGAIVTEDGGITCHAAIVSREFKIPCVVGVKKICSFLNDGDRVSVDAIEGIIRKI